MWLEANLTGSQVGQTEACEDTCAQYTAQVSKQTHKHELNKCIKQFFLLGLVALFFYYDRTRAPDFRVVIIESWECQADVFFTTALAAAQNMYLRLTQFPSSKKVNKEWGCLAYGLHYLFQFFTVTSFYLTCRRSNYGFHSCQLKSENWVKNGRQLTFWLLSNRFKIKALADVTDTYVQAGILYVNHHFLNSKQ